MKSPRGQIFENRSLKDPVADPRLLVKIEHHAQAIGVGEKGRREFMTELKRVDGDIARLPGRVLKERQIVIEKARYSPMWEAGQPTEAHLSLAMWGYTTDQDRLREWAKDLSDRIFITENGLVNVWLPHLKSILEATIAQAIPAVHPISNTPLAPMKSAKRSWLFKYHGGDWEVKNITSSGMQLCGNGIVLHASKDIAHQINLPSIGYFANLARRMGPPGELSEKSSESVKKARRAVGIMDDADGDMDVFGINDDPTGDGQAVGQRWKVPADAWRKQRNTIGSVINRDEGVFPTSARKMMGLEE